MLKIDLHLDLSMNAMEWNRDLRRPLYEIREREKNQSDKPDRGKGTVCFPELRRGDFGLVVATQIARYVDLSNPLPGWHSPEQAWAQTQGQLAWYKMMEAAGELKLIRNRQELEDHLVYWSQPGNKEEKTIGYILSLEGADSLLNMDHLHIAHGYGLRAIGPAHYGPGRYANGTDSSGAMKQPGIDLLKEMQQLQMILDVTHLCDDAFWQALDLYQGPLWASHNLCRALVPHNRQYSDEQIRALIERDTVLGAAMDAWMIVPGWIRGKSTPENMHCSLESVADHIDHICQLAGNARHVAIGTDLDGGYGTEQSPADLDSIADIDKLNGILQRRGYSADDLQQIMQGNALRVLRQAWS